MVSAGVKSGSKLGTQPKTVIRMQGLEVGAIIDSILSSLGNGLEIFKRVGIRRNGRKTSKVTIAPEDRHLHDSLVNGPDKIRSQFSQNAATHGHRFVAGDASAQTNLTHILLALNTGLMETINLALGGSSKTNTMAKQKLLHLSTTTTTDTLSVMSSLHDRLTHRTNSAALVPLPDKQSTSQIPESKQKSKRTKASTSSADRPDSNPLLVRGGWVRTKSGGSMVVSAAAARQRAERKLDKKRLTSRPNRSVLAPIQDDDHFVEASAWIDYPKHHMPKCDCCCALQDPSFGSKPIVNTQIAQIEPFNHHRPPSLYIVPADFFRTEDKVGELPPARPPKIPLHTRPNPSSRPRPPSGATFLSTSTKIGEIPEDRLPDRFLSEEERIFRPLPYTIPPPLLEEPKKKRRGFWRFKT